MTHVRIKVFRQVQDIAVDELSISRDCVSMSSRNESQQ